MTKKNIERAKKTKEGMKKQDVEQEKEKNKEKKLADKKRWENGGAEEDDEGE